MNRLELIMNETDIDERCVCRSLLNVLDEKSHLEWNVRYRCMDKRWLVAQLSPSDTDDSVTILAGLCCPSPDAAEKLAVTFP